MSFVLFNFILQLCFSHAVQRHAIPVAGSGPSSILGCFLHSWSFGKTHQRYRSRDVTFGKLIFEHKWNLGFFPETFPHETCFIILAWLLRGSRAQCVFAALFPSFLQISQSNHSSSISGSSGGHGVCRKSTFSDKDFFNECSLAALNQTWTYKLAGKTEKVPPIGSKHRRQS